MNIPGAGAAKFIGLLPTFPSDYQYIYGIDNLKDDYEWQPSFSSSST